MMKHDTLATKRRMRCDKHTLVSFPRTRQCDTGFDTMTGAFASFLQYDVNRDPCDVQLRWTEWVVRFKNPMLAIAVTCPTRQLAL